MLLIMLAHYLSLIHRFLLESSGPFFSSLFNFQGSFAARFSWALDYNTTPLPLCQALFYTFFNFFFGLWTGIFSHPRYCANGDIFQPKSGMKVDIFSARTHYIYVKNKKIYRRFFPAAYTYIIYTRARSGQTDASPSEIPSSTIPAITVPTHRYCDGRRRSFKITRDSNTETIQ